ncbi:MAG: P-loop NTPase fold protein [Candidatus Methanoperedens sp.]|nr:P-loop NTPase fold protein [Candidatus Methanoperedens sp.]
MKNIQAPPGGNPVSEATIFDDYPESEAKFFNFDAYANAIAGIIQSKKTGTPLVIGIVGDWGSGKTSLMRTIEKKIQENKNDCPAQTIWFNAWKFDKEDSIRRALLMRVLEELKPKGHLFSWDEIPGNDSAILIDFLKQNCNIDWVKKEKIEKIDGNKAIRVTTRKDFLSLTEKFGIGWVKTAKIEKIDNDNAIKVTIGKNFLSLRLNNEKTRDLQISGGSIDKYIVETENGKLSIYPKGKNEKELDKELTDLQASLYHEVNREELGDLNFDLGRASKGALKISLSLVPVIGSNLTDLIEKGANEEAIKDILESVQREKKTINIKKIQFMEEFHNKFAEIIKKYYVNRRVIIFIDDLDRSLPEKALEVLDAIKLFLDVEGCIFVLGIDRRVISYIINKKYREQFIGKGDEGKTNENVLITGENYLEKIIQLSFQLPPIEKTDMKKFIRNMRDLDLEFYGQYLKLIIEGIENNPRKIKRFFNIIELQRNIAKAMNLQEDLSEAERIINDSLMIIWNIICLNHPELRDAVLRDPLILRQVLFREKLSKYFSSNEHLFCWDKIPENDSDRFMNFLKQNYSIDWVKKEKIEKTDNNTAIRVSAEKNYLSFGLNEMKTRANLKIDDVNKGEFIAKTENDELNIYKFMELPEKTKQIDDFLNDKSLSNLLTQFHEYINEQEDKLESEEIPEWKLDGLIQQVISLGHVTSEKVEEKELINLQNNADSLIHEAEDTLKELNDTSPDHKKNIERSIEEIKKVLKEEDTNRIKAAINELTNEINAVQKSIKPQEIPTSEKKKEGIKQYIGLTDELDKSIKNRESLAGKSLHKVDLKGLNLSSINLDGADLSEANLENAKLTRAKLNSAHLENAILNNAKLNNSTLWYANLEKAKLKNADLKDAELYRADLSKADLSGADLYNAGLMSANLKGAVLRGANLRQVNLKGADFDNETDFRGADIDSITIDNLGGSKWVKAQWDPLVLEEIKRKHKV